MLLFYFDTVEMGGGRGSGCKKKGPPPPPAFQLKQGNFVD